MPRDIKCMYMAHVCFYVCGEYVGAVEEMMCVVSVDVTEGA